MATASREQAIEDLKAMRQTHVEWRDHLSNRSLSRPGPHCGRCASERVEEIVGDLSHHEDCISKYDNALAILEAEPESTPTPVKAA